MRTICKTCPEQTKECMYIKNCCEQYCVKVDSYDIGYKAASNKACEVFNSAMDSLEGFFKEKTEDLKNQFNKVMKE